MNSKILIIIGLLCTAVAASTLAAPRPGGGMMGGGMGGGGMMGGGMNKAARLSPALAKVFGEHNNFSADIETEISGDRPMTVPGKLTFDQGKARTEVSLGQAKGGSVPPEMAAQMKAMGMDRMVTISLPEKNLTYMIYPGMEAYVEMKDTEGAEESKPEDFKVKTEKIGNETVDGHPAIKNKVIITDATNEVMNAIVWNATDLKDFPVKIQQDSEGVQITTSFKNVKFDKPAASQFEVPSGYQKYASMMEMMQAMVMKQMGGAGGMGMPPQGMQKGKNPVR